MRILKFWSAEYITHEETAVKNKKNSTHPSKQNQNKIIDLILCFPFSIKYYHAL